MIHWQFCLVTECPCCSSAVEDKSYAQVRVLKWLGKVGWKALSNGFMKAAHEVAEAILWCLEKWRHGGTSSQPIPAACYVHEQEALSWDWFLDGWLAQSWQEYQEQVWKSAHSHCSSKRWIAELIKKLWNMAWDMWAHWNGILHHSVHAQTDTWKGVNEQIGWLHESGFQVLLKDVLSPLHQPKENTLRLPLAAKQQWIESVEVAMNCQKHHEYR